VRRERPLSAPGGLRGGRAPDAQTSPAIQLPRLVVRYAGDCRNAWTACLRRNRWSPRQAVLRREWTNPHPSHRDLRGIRLRLRGAYDTTSQQPNKERRVQQVIGAAVRRSGRARELMDGILAALRVSGSFDPDREGYDRQAIVTLQRALRREGWELTDEGVLVVPLSVRLA